MNDKRQLIIKKRFSICIVLLSWLFIASCLLPIANSFSQGTWAQKANFGGTPVLDAAGFSIGTKGYAGVGYANAGVLLDAFWEWDQTTNTWAQKANFGGSGRQGYAGFSIGAKGYIGTGLDLSGNNTRDFWEWDQATNTWTQQADFGGTERWGAVGFSIGTKGYIGTGYDLSGPVQDFWEWDQATNTWTQKANFSGGASYEVVAFSIGTKGYVGTGFDLALKNDFWEWDQATNIWTQKAAFIGSAREEAVGFAIGNYGYIGVGYAHDAFPCYNDFYQYCPFNNAWTIKASFGGVVRAGAVGFSIGTKGYIGLGCDANWTIYNDFWEYTPDSDPCGTFNVSVSLQNVLCNGQCNGTAMVTPTSGTSPYTYSWSNSQTTQTATGLCAGNYTITLTDATPVATTATLVITQPTLLTATVSATNACGSNNGTASVSASGGNAPYGYSWNLGGQTTSTAIGLGAGTYTATVTDANNCFTSQTVTVSSGSINAATTGSTICSGQSALLAASGGNNYFWSNGNTSSTITVSPTSSSTYSVIVSNGNCSDTASAWVVVNPSPVAIAWSLPAGQAGNITITAGNSATLSATGGISYLWSNGSATSIITVAPPSTTMYCVTVMDANNCTDTTCVTVTIEPLDCANTGELYLPNAFSPNGDGENDVLKIYYGNILCIKTFKLVVYDRWGEKVFIATNPAAEWDGAYKGRIMNAAVFVYYLEATLAAGEKITKKGNISLIR